MTDDATRSSASSRPITRSTCWARARAEAAGAIETLDLDAGETVYARGAQVPGLYAVASGTVEITAGDGQAISHIGLGECFGERGLMRDGRAPVTATMHEGGRLYRLPAALFTRLLDAEPGFARFFGRLPPAPEAGTGGDVAMMTIGDLMTADPSASRRRHGRRGRRHAARARHLLRADQPTAGRLAGIITASDLCGRVLAAGRAPARRRSPR